MLAHGHFIQHARRIIGSVTSELSAVCFLLQFCHTRQFTIFKKNTRILKAPGIDKQTTIHLKPISHIRSATLQQNNEGLLPGNFNLYSFRAYSVPVEYLDGKNQAVLQSLSIKDLVSQAHIKSLAELLGCSVLEVKSLIKQHTFLIHMDPDLIEGKISLLLSYDLPLNFVKQNIRVLYQTSSKVLEDRLEQIKNGGLLHSPFLELDKLPHMLECRGSEFAKTLKLKCDQRDALEGCSDQLTYLQMRLGCSEKAAKSMLNSYPLERHISNVKLKSLLDFLLVEAGRGPDFVISYRKLLTFSLNRLRQRWLVMGKAGIDTESQIVYIWCMPQRDFEAAYKEHLK